jgi:hypothetical protein
MIFVVHSLNASIAQHANLSDAFQSRFGGISKTMTEFGA